MRSTAEWSRIGVAFVALLAAGMQGCCKKEKRSDDAAPLPGPSSPAETLDSVIAKYKPKIEPKLSAAVKIGASLPKPASRPGVKPDQGAVRLLAGPTRTIAQSDAGAVRGNATILDPEDLAGDLTSSERAKYGMRENLLLDCAAIIAKKEPVSTFAPADDLKQTAAVLDQCASLTYLLVLRAANKTDPLVDKDAKRFVPGHVEGSILVFNLDSGKQLGSYKVSGRNSAELEVDMSDPWADLRREMSQKLWASISDGLSKYAPGSSIINLY